ncbi:MAG: T9SS type A sorting domain-containing protein [Bacteroidota bacterium]
MTKKISILFILLKLVVNTTLAQLKPIPIGTWRSHFDYTKGKALTKAGNKIFFAANNGFFEFDITENEATILSNSDGFYDLNISQLAYNGPTKTLVIAYHSGAIDLVNLDNQFEIVEISNLLAIKNSATILNSKLTNDITFSENIAFLSTDFGIVQIDLVRKQIKEIDQNLSPEGLNSRIVSLAIIGQKVYAMSDKYFLETTLTNNLQNYGEWTYREFPNNYEKKNHKLLSVKNEIYSHIIGLGLFKFTENKFKKLVDVPEETTAIQTNGTDIYIGLKNKLLVYEIGTNNLKTINDTNLIAPQQLLVEGSKVYIADQKNGLVSNLTGNFQKYNPSNTPGLLLSRNDSTVKDFSGIIYTKLRSGSGLEITNSKGQKRSYSNIPLNTSNTRSSNTVNSLAVDKNNIVYVATNGGIVGINSSESIIEADNLTGFIITPIIDGVRTLANELVLSIAVDGGNRKWVGTNNSLYLFNEELSEILEKFTSVNSPLPSDKINFLNIEPISGELFIYTDNGIVSYRTTATESTDIQEDSVLVFPNPVKPSYSGLIGISGLVNNALVKITDISGRLVFQTRANGGTATWDLNSQNGKRAESGIYYIFSSNEFGKENLVTKLAVIK